MSSIREMTLGARSLVPQTIALFVRSLRRDSRNIFSHLLRGGLVVVLVIICMGAYRNLFMATAGGLRMFTLVMWVNFLFISVAAIGYFSTSITEEKEEDTLGLLRMAGIGPMSLLLGKSISRLWLALVLLAIQFPFALLSVTLGGVTLRQVAACYLALGVYTYFLSGLATLCSVTNSRSMRAVVYMVVATVFVFFLPNICDLITDTATRYCPTSIADKVDTVMMWFRQISMSTRLMNVMSTTFDDPLFDSHFRVSATAGTALYALAWLLFDFFAYRQIAVSDGQTKRRFLKSLGLTAGRAWPGGIVWKDFNFGTGGVRAWLMRLTLVIATTTGFGWLAYESNPNWFDMDDIAQILFSSSLFFIVIELMVHSVRFLSAEQNQKTLAVLAMTPSSGGKILLSKLCGLLLGITPFAFAFLTSLYLKPEYLGDFMAEATKYPETLFGMVYFVLLFVVFFHLNAFLATYVKWAAAPMSFGILFAFSMCCVFAFEGPGVSRDTGRIMLFFMDCVACGSIATMIVVIGKRFEKLQGD